jgi:hypothetical protein
MRLAAYMALPSLWHDEAALALNVIERSFAALLRPLDYHQAAPVGFLLLEKLVTSIAGRSEWALRLVPFAAGLLSVPLVYLLAVRTAGRLAAVVALWLFALCGPAIVYANEFKQYGVDVLISLLLLLLAHGWWRSNYSVRWSAAMVLSGAAAVWISHPSAFVLAAIGVAFAADALVTRRWRPAAAISLVSLGWLASFAGSYALATGAVASDSYLLHFWQGRFMPFPPTSLADLMWVYQKALQLFKHPVGLKDMPGLGLALALTGIVVFWFKSRVWLAVLGMPVVLALAASALHLYPFEGRFLMFALPGLLVLVSAGVAHVLERLEGGGWVPRALFVALVFSGPFALAQQTGRWPSEQEEMRSVLAEVAAEIRPGDRVMLYHNAEPAYRYYAEYRADLWKTRLPNDWSNFEGVGVVDDVCRQGDAAARVWLLFSRVESSRYRGANAEGAILPALDQCALHLRSLHAPGASAYLYSRAPGVTAP